MNSFLNFVISVLGGTVAALAVVAFLGRRWLDYALEKSLKDHEVRLVEKTEALKTKLAIYAHEQEIALARVDNQRAEAINRVYAALKDWTRPTSHIVAGCPIVNPELAEEFRFYIENAEEAHLASKQLADILSAQAIYFDSETYDRLAEIVGKSGRLTADFLRPLREADAQDVDRELIAPHMLEERKRLVALYEEEIAPLHRDLTTRFRELLGVERE